MALVTTLKIGTSSYTFDASQLGGYTAAQWKALYEVVMAADNDSVINNLTELLAIFSAYPEGASIVEALALKSDKTHKHTVTPKGNIYVDGSTTAGEYKPAGTVNSTLKFDDTASTTGITGATTVPTATHTHSVSGTVTIKKGTGTANYTPEGTVSAPSFTGNELTSTGTFTPNVAVNTQSFSGTAFNSTGKFTPAGNITQPTISISPSTGDFLTSASLSGGATPTTKTVSVVTSVGTFSGGSKAKLDASYTAADQTLTLTFTANNLATLSGTASADINSVTSVGSMPTLSTTDDKAMTSATASASGAAFTGTQGDVSVSGTPTGTISVTLKNNAGTVSVKGTPTGTNGTPTFSGTGAQLVATLSGASATKTDNTTTVASNSHTHTYTKADTVTSTFEGTKASFEFEGESSTTEAANS